MSKGSIINQEIITSEAEENEMEEENKATIQFVPNDNEPKEESSDKDNEDFQQVVKLFTASGIIYGNSISHLPIFNTKSNR